MRLKFLSVVLLTACLLTGMAHAEGGGPQAFVEAQQVKVTGLLRQPASPSRDAQVTQVLETMVDYNELVRRTLGAPCPAAESSCQNHWNDLTAAQKAEVTDLLKRLIQKNYRKNLVKTLDYDITYKGTRDAAGDMRIRTEAKSKLKPRDPPVQVDYVVRAGNGDYRVVDIVTEGSSLTKNYYDQFHRMLTNPAQGYPHMATKLREKIEKRD